MISFELSNQPWANLSLDQKQNLLLLLLALVALWTLLFIVLRFALLPQRSYDFNNRLVSIVHVVASLWLATLAIDFKNPVANPGGPNTLPELRTMVVSMSYFIYDMFGCMFDATIDPVILLHHAFTILGYAYGVAEGRCGQELVACLWLMELSNPFMHLRVMFKELKMEGLLAAVNDGLFVSSFILARMVVGPFLVYATVTGNSAIGVKIGAIAVQVVSALWFYKIARFIYFKITGKKRKQQ